MEKKMKRKFMPVISILVIAVISACGGTPAAPTLSVADLQGTAVANAWVAITQTQAAMPTATATPIPPTPTATFTALPVLVLVPTFASVATIPPTSAANPCNDPPPTKPKGAMVKIKLINKSGGNVSPLSLGMVQENSFKECGTYSYSLGISDEQVVDVLAGCYWGYGYVNGKTPSTAQTSSNLCMTDTSKITAIWITKDLISFH